MLPAVKRRSVLAAIAATGFSRVALAQIPARGAYFVPDRDFGALCDGVADDAAALNAGFSSGARIAELTPGRTYTIKSRVDVPTNGRIIGNGAVFNKGADGDMMALAESAVVQDLRLQGAGTRFAGRGAVITRGNRQRLLDCDVKDMRGYCVEVETIDTGVALMVETGFYQRTGGEEAIRLPGSGSNYGVDADSMTTGHRHLTGIDCGGGRLVDLGGSDYTWIADCGTTGITFRPGSRYARIEGTRIAGNVDLYGNGHVVGPTTAIAGRITLHRGVQGCTVFQEGGSNSDISDLSGETNNNLYFQAEFIPGWRSGGEPPVLGDGTLRGRYARSGRHVAVTIRLAFGPATRAGTGPYRFALPVPVDAPPPPPDTLGTALAASASGGAWAGVARFLGPEIAIAPAGGGAQPWGATYPTAWKPGDRIAISFSYDLG